MRQHSQEFIARRISAGAAQIGTARSHQGQHHPRQHDAGAQNGVDDRARMLSDVPCRATCRVEVIEAFRIDSHEPPMG
ncbi:hypothetical protein [Mesorhizobium sp. KR1-2]|uniref:hypothetical protein n=1 Tax=Mesorhizobium sp. KR1-2 TaxID=3156609 RepID=UPI0032B60722